MRGNMHETLVAHFSSLGPDGVLAWEEASCERHPYCLSLARAA